TYQVKAHDTGILSVLFINHIDDQPDEEWMTLFPGEESRILELPRQKNPFVRPLIFGSCILLAFFVLRVFQKMARTGSQS
ncbi:MAG: hypothetical protein HKN23_20910, partial [Verrucomicrobiales bacterium]|nr:hypothetical protein [Verrucomicrobiales bacterium]